MRLLLVTTDPSLGVALAFDDPGREVTVTASVAEARQLPPGAFDACVIDVGSTARGVRIADVLRESGIADALVVADRGEPVPGASRYRYLQRPFTVAQLDAALERLVRGRGAGAQHQAPRRRFLGRLFESGGSWTTRPTGRSGADLRPEGARRTMTPDAAAASVEILALREEPGAIHLPEERVVGARGMADLLASVMRVEDLVDEQPHLADLQETSRIVSGRLSDELAAARTTIWLHLSDGSHVRLPARGSTIEGPRRVAPGHPLLDLLTRSADGVRIDDARHPWLVGVADGLGVDEGSVAIAAALRIGHDYHGAVVSFGRGFTTTDRDRLADLAWEATPALALAATLERLGPQGRLFGLGALENAAPN